MTKAMYKPTGRAVASLAVSPTLSTALTRIAAEHVPEIQAVAPKRTGRYAASIRATPAMVRTPFTRSPASPKLRAGAVIEATVPYAAAVEWGTGDAIGFRGRARKRDKKVLPRKLQRRGAQHVLGNAAAAMRKKGL
ncbi:hypothetical protein FYZ44_05275 [Mobiluncus mulieris]|uniref:hypothetical protein n=1 Tax=Mobiluncus mulieris TaxID=2052 RepID=UPI0021E209DA|nr:hypothetical protein [Mobiluncus mulieris]MCU9996280.1 hypothetical protein [Mobiluncus mulieris]